MAPAELESAQAAHKEAILSLLAQRDGASATSEADWSYAKDKCLHELFETHASRTPDAVAAVYGDEQITPVYAPKDECSNPQTTATAVYDGLDLHRLLVAREKLTP